MPTKKEYREYLRSNHWKLVKENKLRLAGNRCERCGVTSETKKLNVHHLHYRTLMEEKPEDLQVVCDDCHIKADKERVETDWDGSIKNFWQGQLRSYADKVYGYLWKNRLSYSELEEKIYLAINNENKQTSQEDLALLMYSTRIESDEWRGNPYTSWLLPLDKGWINNYKLGTWLYSINAWQKNFTGYCAEVGCREPIENNPEWGTYERPPNWIAWGLDVLEPPKSSWLPTYCKIHNREIDVVALADDVRKLLTQMLLDRSHVFDRLRELGGEIIDIS